MTAGEVLVERLIDWGVEVIFGLPGDGINGIMEALRIHQDNIRFIQVRHEESAAFMACGYAKFTGKLGVCLATSGPGGIHLLNGLYDAKLDHQPVLAITGLQFHDLIGTHTQQDVALDKLFMDVCVYNERIMGPNHVENVVDLACRTALAYRGVSHITDLQSAAEVLNAGKKIAILAGQGSLHAGDELGQVAELIGAPIVKALLGKAAVPDDSPYTTGSIGLLGTRPSQEVMEECDTIFIVGSAFPYIEYMPKPDQARGVQIDRDPQQIGLRYPVEVGLVGDSRRILQALFPLLKRNSNRKFLEKAQSGMKDWWQIMEERGTRRDKPMNPQVVAWELGKRLPHNAITACDSGTIATWWARQVPAKRGQMHTLSGNLATMACGLPYALAAQVAYPDRPVIAFVGDGGFSMLMADFVTAVKYQLPIKVVIIKNNVLGQIKWEQMVFLGNPEFGVQLHPINFAEFAHACGGVGFTVEEPEECGTVMEQFLAAPGPAILQAVVDQLEPPLPGKITGEQALHFAESLARGEPNRGKIALTAVSDKVREMI